MDIIQDVPGQDLGRVSSTAGLKVGTAAQNRVIFFGVDNADGPTADLRVRQAMNIAINREAIKKVVMREQFLKLQATFNARQPQMQIKKVKCPAVPFAVGFTS